MMKLLHFIKGKIIASKNWFLKASLLKKIIVLLVIIGIGWFVIKPIVSGGKSSAITYQTETAEKGTLITSVTASGTVSSGNSANITSNATGVVSEVYVKDGDTVYAGQNIAAVTLDLNAQQKQTQAWASYLSAQNSLNSAKSKMNSLQASLFEANQTFVTGTGIENPITDDPQYIIEKARWQQAEADYTNQENVIRQTEAALSSAWLSYSQLSPTITAPISGVISNLSIAPGTSLSSTTGTDSTDSSSTTIGSVKLPDGTPQATVNLTEIDIPKIEIGQKVTITMDAFTDKSFTGKVTAINTNGTSSSGVTSYPVTITFDTGLDKIYPNMAVNTTIITDIKNNVLLVPSSAVQTQNGESTVRVQKNGKITSVTVETGKSNDSETEIISGLTEGETVVTGQTGGNTGTGTSTQTTSPFGGTTGAGGARTGGFGGGTGGTRTFIRQ